MLEFEWDDQKATSNLAKTVWHLRMPNACSTTSVLCIIRIAP